MKITLALCLTAAAAGCAKTDSSDLLTTGIYAGITAQADGTGSTRVSTTLYVGSPANLNFVDLTGDDKLVASHGSSVMIMSELTILNIVSHQATFNTDASGDQFQVSFERSVDEGAPNSLATLPDKFTIDAPPTTASRAQPLTLTWSPIDGATPMRWQATGDCIDGAGENQLTDGGSLTITANQLKKKMDPMTMDQCMVTITMTRVKQGVLDDGYGKGGQVEGQQIRRVMLTSMP